MKKGLRNTVLSLATLLALVSCGAPKVTEEVAKQRAQEITARREAEDFELPKKITVTAKAKADISAKMGSEKQSQSVTEEVKMVLDLENHYYHMEISASADGSTERTEQWCYIEGTTAILAIDDENGKMYQEGTVTDPAQFEEVFDSILNNVYSVVLDSQYLQIDNLDQTLLSTVQGYGLTGELDSKASYTSSAEGNLGIAIEANISDVSIDIEEGTAPIKISSSLDAKISFDNYLLSLL